MSTKSLMRLLGAIATGLGLAASAISGYVKDKKEDEKIDERARKIYLEMEEEKQKTEESEAEES